MVRLCSLERIGLEFQEVKDNKTVASIIIRRCENIPNMDVNYTADPYIKIYAFDSIRKGSAPNKLVKLTKTHVVTT